MFRDANIMSYSWQRKHPPPYPVPAYTTFQKYLYFTFTTRTFIDILIIVPFYAKESTNTFAVFRVFRILFIIENIERLHKILEVFVLTLNASSIPLFVIGFVALIFIVFLGSLMYLIEQGQYQVTADYGGAYLVNRYGSGMVPTGFTDIPASMYFVVTSSTTVGYGDITPASTIGRFVACLIFYSGIIGIALPIAVISNNFNQSFEIVFHSISPDSSFNDTNNNSNREGNEVLNDDKVVIVSKHPPKAPTSANNNEDVRSSQVSNNKVLTPRQRIAASTKAFNEVVDTSMKNRAKAKRRNSELPNVDPKKLKTFLVNLFQAHDSKGDAEFKDAKKFIYRVVKSSVKQRKRGNDSTGNNNSFSLNQKEMTSREAIENELKDLNSDIDFNEGESINSSYDSDSDWWSGTSSSSEKHHRDSIDKGDESGSDSGDLHYTDAREHHSTVPKQPGFSNSTSEVNDISSSMIGIEMAKQVSSSDNSNKSQKESANMNNDENLENDSVDEANDSTASQQGSNGTKHRRYHKFHRRIQRKARRSIHAAYTYAFLLNRLHPIPKMVTMRDYAGRLYDIFNCCMDRYVHNII